MRNYFNKATFCLTQAGIINMKVKLYEYPFVLNLAGTVYRIYKKFCTETVDILKQHIETLKNYLQI